MQNEALVIQFTQKAKDSEDGMYLTFRQWNDILDNLLDGTSTIDHRDYLLAKLYNIDKDLMKLNYSNFFKIFDGKHKSGKLTPREYI